MIQFSTEILKFGKMGEKSGWTYIVLTAEQAQILSPKNKKSFRVKGTLDDYKIKSVATMPMGDGEFILAINAEMRKGTGKKEGDQLKVKLEIDKDVYELDVDLVACLNEDKDASKAFYDLPRSHQNYYSKWIQTAKTSPTKAKRIAQTMEAMLAGMTFAEMLKSNREIK
ncbi:MAG: DUF1905 domain-containing protein [Flavobacteriales bacterium]